MSRMTVFREHFNTWKEAREFIAGLEEDEHWKQTDWWSYKDGSGDATYVNEWDWQAYHITWNDPIA